MILMVIFINLADYQVDFDRDSCDDGNDFDHDNFNDDFDGDLINLADYQVDFDHNYCCDDGDEIDPDDVDGDDFDGDQCDDDMMTFILMILMTFFYQHGMTFIMMKVFLMLMTL